MQGIRLNDVMYNQMTDDDDGDDDDDGEAALIIFPASIFRI